MFGDVHTVVILDKTVKHFLMALLVLYGSFLFSFSVDESVKKLSFRERRHMKAFFDKAIKMEQAGHVLYYKTKPATLIAIVLQSRGKVIKEEMRALQGWKTFKKHETIFPHPNFIFTENLFEPDEDLTVLHIYLINKSSLRVCLTKYKSIFEQVLGKNFSANQFITQLEIGTSLPSLIKKDELLMGLLLGFGEESSRAFKKLYAKSKDEDFPVQSEIIQCVKIKRPKACDFMPVIFTGNPNSSEVKQLVSIYERELEEVWNIYEKSKNPLKTALECLCKQ